MGGEKVTLDLADLKDALPAAAAALSAKDRVGFLDTLKSLADEYTDMVETFSLNVIKRVEFLREIQRQYDEIEVKFFEERTVLEAKYQKLYEPLYTKRYEIVNGVVEADGVSDEPTSENAAERKESDAKGVPAFWLTAMKTNDALAAEIQERDEPALKYMKDIKWSRIKDLKGFKLEFFFDTNPFFKNSVLTKTYHMVEEYDLILEKAAGTEIEWYPKKNLTQKIIKKKPKKGSKNAKRIIKTKACDSFFNFFSPPLIPDDGVEIDDADELRGQMEHDYDIGTIIRYKIIPHAVSWFTSEAVESKDFEDTDDGDDDEEEDDEAEESKPMKKVPQKVGSQAE